VPTIVDAPRINVEIVEREEPGLPFGMKGASEVPLCNALPAVAAAVRDATGLELAAYPIEPQHIALGDRGKVGPAPMRLGSDGHGKGPWSPATQHGPQHQAIDADGVLNAGACNSRAPRNRLG
jgi:hypothetical protein